LGSKNMPEVLRPRSPHDRLFARRRIGIGIATANATPPSSFVSGKKSPCAFAPAHHHNALVENPLRTDRGRRGGCEPADGGSHLIPVRPTLSFSRNREASEQESAVEAPSDTTDRNRRPETIESLKGLLEQLGSAELTLPEAKRLRSRLHRMLSRGDRESEGRGDRGRPWIS